MCRRCIVKKFWYKNKRIILRSIISTITLIFFVFVIPIVIDWMYKIPARLPIFAMSWESKDVLSFYGSILGAAATIIALTKTIKFTRENQREERKLSIRPYLETRKYNYTNFEDIPNKKDVIYLDIMPNLITYQGGLPDDISAIQDLKNRKAYEENYNLQNLDEVLYNTSTIKYFNDKYLLYYEIINCGAGNAINVSFNINSRCIIPSFCVTTTESKKIMLVLNKELLELSGEYELKLAFVYYDIASLAQYYQTETIIFTNKNKKGELKTLQKSGAFLTGPMEMAKTSK